MSLPRVSVIVTTKNSEEFLDESLRTIQICRKEYLGESELIVVDIFSADKTIDIAHRYADKVYQTGPERTAQANYGISKSSGDIIYLTGSDMTRSWFFITQGVNKIQEGYDAVYMSVLTDARVKHFWGRVKAMEREMYIGTRVESARFFKREVYDRLGGFDENLVALEEDFQHRLDAGGFKTGWIGAREFHLHEEDSLFKVFKKFYYYGKFCRHYLKKHRVRGVKYLNPIRPNLGLLKKHPVLFGGFIVYKAVQYAGGSAGLLCG